jgi:hypothetical protein
MRGQKTERRLRGLCDQRTGISETRISYLSEYRLQEGTSINLLQQALPARRGEIGQYASLRLALRAGRPRSPFSRAEERAAMERGRPARFVRLFCRRDNNEQAPRFTGVFRGSLNTKALRGKAALSFQKTENRGQKTGISETRISHLSEYRLLNTKRVQRALCLLSSHFDCPLLLSPEQE